MGEVYRASDTRLDRVVALKILRREVSDHPARRQRFEREARAVASLSHPHICTLHDVGEADGALFLVMEYLEGETLAQRLRRGALPMQDVLRYAIEIADALDHAHREGIVHRDLKPANIMLTRSGTKLLDFGLAKALARAEETGSGLRAMSASAGAASLAETEPLTEEGTILGTVHYMAPEQLEARETDARTDIFAFGAVLYEMLSGRKAFEGGSKASVIAAVLEHDPPPLDLRATDVTGSGPVAPLLDHVIARCLAKSPDERWQSAGDLMRELQWIAGSGTHLGLPARTSAQGSRRGRLVAASLIGLTSVAAIVAVVGIWRPASTDERAVQFVVGPPEGSAFNPAPAFMAVSPDGRHLAFSAANRGAGMALWLRSLDSLDLRQLTTEEGAQPFWSPDSRIVAFYARAEYKRMDIRTGRVQTLINARGQSGTWSRAGEIVMKLADRPVLSRFSVDGGGPPIPATTLDVARDEVLHTWPQFLPDGRRFLYVARSARPEYDKTICVGSLDSNSRTVLFKADSHAAYAAGYLLYMRGSTLTAQPFDATNLRATGEPVPVADRVESSAFGNRGSFSISDTDVLAYRGIGDTRLLWLDRAGRVLATIGPPGNYANPALSPDGRRAAVARLDPEAGAPDIWLIELARGALSRFTFTSSSEDMPLWSPDGGRIVFRATRTPGMAGFYDKASSGTGSDELVLDGLSAFVNPLGWSRKGGALVYGSQSDKTLTDLWELRRGDRTSVALVQSEFHEIQGQPSPDGQWIA
jgi:tRNA A-37 threonylcarbamoyl transferase component Bud32